MAPGDDDTRPLTQASTLAAGWSEASGPSGDWQEGQRIGPYRLKRLLGQGGMGRVWLAEQLEPLRRQVAIKVALRAARDAVSEAYFEVERQAMAQLSHPAIAQIHDAGRLPDGALFFAMEYVPGEPMDAFLASRTVSMADRVRLMVEVCQAVQHAHQRGLIHRDLKPQNLLVQHVDGRLMPKIIDFGIAVGVGPDRMAQLAHIGSAGTPAYMAPEQKRGEGRIDARVDIYALGALLVDLLGPKWNGTETAERDGETRPPPSANHPDQAHPEAELPARRRAAGLRAAPPELRAIALKALAVDPEQRYSSAAALADDLRAWLDHRPVQAAPGGRLYTLRCFMRRHRLATIAATMVVLALLAGILLALHGLERARDALGLAEQRRDDGERLIHYMLGDFADKLRPISRLDLLDGVGQEALNYLSAQAKVADARGALARARALRTLGEVQTTRQQFDLALRSLEEAAQVLTPWLDTSSADAELVFEAGTIAFWRGTVRYRLNEDDATEVHWREYLARAEQLQALAPEDRRSTEELAYAHNNLGTLAERRGQLPEARDRVLHAVALRRSLLTVPADPVAQPLANALSWLSRIQNQLGEPRAALASVLEALDLITDLRKVEDSGRLLQQEANLRYIVAMNRLWLGETNSARQDLAQAVQLARQDVANDPSQPRRHAFLARVLLLQLPLLHPQEAEGAALLAEAQASHALAAADISPAENLRVEVLSCLARLHLAQGASAFEHCRNQVWPQIETQLTDSPDAELLELASELATRLHELSPEALPTPQLQALMIQLEDEPDPQRINLDRLLKRRQLLSRLEPEGQRLAELDQRIAEMRTRTTTTQETSP